MRGTTNQSENLTGTMNAVGNCVGSLAGVSNLVGTYEKSTQYFVPEYTGEVEVTPTSGEQLLETKNKKLKDNITVHATPYSSVSNPYGGNTVTIL